MSAVLSLSRPGGHVSYNRSLPVITPDEEDQFYGVPVTRAQIEEARERYALCWDEQDAADAAMENHIALSAALNRGDLCEAGRLLQDARQVTIARRVGLVLFGSVDALTVAELGS